MKKININLKITNNTALPQTAELFSPLADRNPLTSEYEFDLSTEDFIGITAVTQRYLVAPSPAIFSFIGGTVTDIDSLVTLLNTANIGIYRSVGTTLYCATNSGVVLFDLVLA